MVNRKVKSQWVREVLIAIISMLLVAIAASLLRGQDRIVSYRVVDGDTVHATVDLGWDTLIKAKIRLNGFSAPERNEPGGTEATQALTDALQSANVITAVPTGKKTFDRWVADIYVDGDNIRTHLDPPLESSTLEPLSVTTQWQQNIQLQLNEAGIKAAFRNKSFTVVVPEGEYEFTNLVIPPHVSLVADPIASRSVRLRYVGSGNHTLFTLQGGYGSRLAGFVVDAWAPGLVGIRAEKTLNATIEDCRIALTGKDTIGAQIAGRESLTANRLELRCAVPAQYIAGDNIVFRDCDLGATGNNEVLPNTVLHLAGLPHQLTIETTTAQGGDYLVYGDIPDAYTTGQILMLQGIRWEQSTSADDPSKPGILIQCRGRSFEGLVQIGCRWSHRRNVSTVVTGASWTPTLTELGNFKPVKK